MQIGGSINFAAVVEALQLSSAALVAAAFGADNAVMALYLMVMMLIPADAPGRSSVRGARGRSGAGGSEGNDPVAGDDIAPSKPRACSDEAREEATGTRIQGDESVATKATEQTILSGVTTALFACILGRAIARAAGVPVASSAFTAVVAAAGAWVGGRARLFTGARELGGAAMQLLFAVIGAQAGSLGALREAGAVAAFVAVQVRFVVAHWPALGLVRPMAGLAAAIL